MVYCCAVGCPNDSRFVSKGQGISFRRFPTEVSLLKEWLAKISRVGLAVTKDTRLCSFHFEPDCFERDLRAELLGSKVKRKLKPDAVPTIFDHRPRKKPRLSTEQRLQEKSKKEVRKLLATCNQVLLTTRKENARNCCTLNGHVIVVLICSILPLLLQPYTFLSRMMRDPLLNVVQHLMLPYL